MNYLELCQKLAREAEITASMSIPAAVTGQTGQLARVVGWVSDAYKDIQRRHDWRWMRRPFTFNTVADDDTYAFGDVTDVDTGLAIARFKRWWVNDACDPFQAYLQSGGVAGQFRLIYMPWTNFKWIYRHGTQTSNRPVHVTVDHQNNLVLGPKPNAVYVVTGDFQRGVQVLAADADEPEMPEDYHDVIWRTAIQMYGANAVAAEIFTRAQMEANKTMRTLEREQLPELELAGPLA